MRQIGSNTWGVHDIVKRELVNERAVLQQKRKRLFRLSVCAGSVSAALSTDLADAAGSSKNNCDEVSKLFELAGAPGGTHQP